MIKKIVLCADDYGQSSGISQAILELANRKSISAVSCMVNTPTSASAASRLKSSAEQIDIGLHFNLTHGKPLSAAFGNYYGADFGSLTQLMWAAYRRRLDPAIIAAECAAQIDQFQAHYGFLPMFIDGHQHVHQFPVIREAVITLFKQRLSKNAYMRYANPRPYSLKPAILAKQMVITLLGSATFEKRLREEEVPYNETFSGIYSFAGDYRAYFKGFLTAIGEYGILMCHPGLAEGEQEDGIARARYQEYRYFLSDAFNEDCRQNNILLSRFLNTFSK